MKFNKSLSAGLMLFGSLIGGHQVMPKTFPKPPSSIYLNGVGKILLKNVKNSWAQKDLLPYKSHPLKKVLITPLGGLAINLSAILLKGAAVTERNLQIWFNAVKQRAWIFISMLSSTIWQHGIGISQKFLMERMTLIAAPVILIIPIVGPYKTVI